MSLRTLSTTDSPKSIVELRIVSYTENPRLRRTHTSSLQLQPEQAHVLQRFQLVTFIVINAWYNLGKLGE